MDGVICQKKPAKKWKRKTDSRAHDFRRTYAWQREAAEIQERDHYLCKICFIHGKRFTYEGLEVHHIEPLHERFDLRLDDANLITLCGAHHKEAEDGRIGRTLLAGIADQEVPPLPNGRS